MIVAEERKMGQLEERGTRGMVVMRRKEESLDDSGGRKEDGMARGGMYKRDCGQKKRREHGCWSWWKGKREGMIVMRKEEGKYDGLMMMVKHGEIIKMA